MTNKSNLTPQTPDQIAQQHFVIGQGYEKHGRYREAHRSYMLAYGTSSIQTYLDAANVIRGKF